MLVPTEVKIISEALSVLFLAEVERISRGLSLFLAEVEKSLGNFLGCFWQRLKESRRHFRVYFDSC